MLKHSGDRLRSLLGSAETIPFMGVYDAFSAAIAGRYYQTLFLSGYGFGASYYGLPDIGFIAWADMVNFVQRLRTILPEHLLLVDIDDGYVDVQTACHVVRQLEQLGAAGVILEDQKRPRRCGHVDGKQLLDTDSYGKKLTNVLAARDRLFVVARTDATELPEIIQRCKHYANIGADAVLADGIKDLGILKTLKSEVSVPIVFNQIAGGKSPTCTLTELNNAGVSLVNYSTPCLFAAQAAITAEMERLSQADGRLSERGLSNCNQVLQRSLDNSSRLRAYD
ncbi:MAG: isocitrate lyase/PEP mutase family protein [Cyanobacteria bacterium P01_H01_bin.15]